MSRARQLADSADLNFDSGTLVIDSANNRVGVGEEAPNGTLHVKGSSAKIILEGTNNGGNSEHYLGTSGSSEQDFVINAGSDTMLIQSDFMLFRNSSGSSEAARIDSSGNLLVGHTSFGLASQDGAYLAASGTVAGSRTSDVSGYFNRRSTDGNIVTFNKDGTTVGSIGATFGDLYIGTGDVGLQMVDGSDCIAPLNSNTPAVRDAAIDLGLSSGRFRNLYLSGGVYLGGTGAANKLDDYEEGTWTPAFATTGTGFSAITYNTGNTTGRYTKIGDTVFFHAVIMTNSITLGSASGDVTITGLPFTNLNIAARDAVTLAEQGRYGAWNTTPSGGSISAGTPKIGLVKLTTLGAAHGGLSPSDLQTSANKNFLMFTGFYKTA